MSRALDDLTPQFRLFAFEFLARAVEAGVPLLIVDTLRTQAEQAQKLAQGLSWTQHSKHLPGADGLSRAIDVAPYEVFQLHGPDKLNWDATLSTWGLMAALAKAVALRQGILIRCGYDWKATPDPGHFELAGELAIGQPV